MDIGSAVGRQQGVTEEQLRHLDAYETHESFTAEQRAVLRFADGLTATPCFVSDEVFDGLRGFYDEEQIVELGSALAWENYRARFDHALHIGSEGFSEGAFCALPVK